MPHVVIHFRRANMNLVSEGPSWSSGYSNDWNAPGFGKKSSSERPQQISIYKQWTREKESRQRQHQYIDISSSSSSSSSSIDTHTHTHGRTSRRNTFFTFSLWREGSDNSALFKSMESSDKHCRISECLRIGKMYCVGDEDDEGVVKSIVARKMKWNGTNWMELNGMERNV